MAQASIIIIGPQGCGKSLNAKALAEAYGLPHWTEAGTRFLPKQDHLILANEVPPGARGLRVIQFSEAIKKVAKPHPATPGLNFAFSTGHADFLIAQAKGKRFWPVSGV